jgi:hypothetical protein
MKSTRLIVTSSRKGLDKIQLRNIAIDNPLVLQWPGATLHLLPDDLTYKGIREIVPISQLDRLFVVLHETAVGNEYIREQFLTDFPDMHAPLISFHGDSTVYGLVVKPLLTSKPWDSIEHLLPSFFTLHGLVFHKDRILNQLLLNPLKIKAILKGSDTPAQFIPGLKAFAQEKNLEALATDLHQITKSL